MRRVRISIDEMVSHLQPEKVVIGQREFTSFSTDTRTLQEGDLFIALPGERFDGADFIPEALRRGAGGVICAAGRGPERTDLTLLEVDDPYRALMTLGVIARKKAAAKFVAITGSNGKTTVKEMVAAMLSAAGRTHKNPQSFNNHIGVPLALLQMSGTESFAVLEVGMNHAGEIDRLTRIVSPDAGLITNIGRAHIGLLGSREAIARAKAELWQHINPKGVMLVNADEPLIVEMASGFPIRKVTFGHAETCDVRPIEIRHDAALVSAFGSRCEMPLMQPGMIGVANLIAACAVAVAVGVGLDAAKEGLMRNYTSPARRLNVIRRGNVLIIDDTYNANTDSMLAALDFLRATGGKRKIAVLGDMMELGDFSPQEHETVGEATGFADFLVCVGRYAPYYVSGAVRGGMSFKKIKMFDQMDHLLEFLSTALKPGDVLLVKGSRAARMERVVDHLLKISDQRFGVSRQG